MITVNDLGYLRAPEPEDLQWLYGVENDATLWYLGISKEPWSKAVLADYLAAQPGNLQRDGRSIALALCLQRRNCRCR